MDFVGNDLFMDRCFGEYAPECRSVLVASGVRAHDRSLEAKAGSGLKTNHAYGSTFWLALPEEVCNSLIDILPGASMYGPSGSQYDLILWNGVVVLPVKVLESNNRGSILHVRVSKLRMRLAGVNGPVQRQPSLFDELEGFDHDDFDAESTTVIDPAQLLVDDAIQQVVIAAYSCSAKSGLSEISIGVGSLGEDGAVYFSDSEKLSVLEQSRPIAPQISVVGERFDDVPRPKPLLEAVEGEAAAVEGLGPEIEPDGL